MKGKHITNLFNEDLKVCEEENITNLADYWKCVCTECDASSTFQKTKKNWKVKNGVRYNFLSNVLSIKKLIIYANRNIYLNIVGYDLKETVGLDILEQDSKDMLEALLLCHFFSIYQTDNANINSHCNVYYAHCISPI